MRVLLPIPKENNSWFSVYSHKSSQKKILFTLIFEFQTNAFIAYRISTILVRCPNLLHNKVPFFTYPFFLKTISETQIIIELLMHVL